MTPKEDIKNAFYANLWTAIVYIVVLLFINDYAYKSGYASGVKAGVNAFIECLNKLPDRNQ